MEGDRRRLAGVVFVEDDEVWLSLASRVPDRLSRDVFTVYPGGARTASRGRMRLAPRMRIDGPTEIILHSRRGREHRVVFDPSRFAVVVS